MFYLHSAATATAVSVEHIPQSDARVFPEYILPSLSMVPYDNDPLVRVALATTLGPLCDAANGRVDEAEQARARAVDGSFTDDEHKARIASHRDAVQDAFFASMTSFLASSDISCTPFELRVRHKAQCKDAMYLLMAEGLPIQCRHSCGTCDP